MKTATWLMALWCVTIGGSAQEAPKVQPVPLFDDLSTGKSPDDESLAARHREAIEKARVEEQRGMEAVVFSEECVTVSEPADRLLFTHEVNVVAFIATRGKFGFDRVSTIHMSNPRLETHGGVAFGPVLSLGKWQEKGQQYELTRPWGMIGDIDQSKPKAYLFRPSPYLKRRTAGSNTEKSPKVEAYDLSRFEEYALTRLNKGEKLVRWERPDAMHAVGAVRAETQCLRCHEGARWNATKFDHQKTDYPLIGKHLDAKCEGCHKMFCNYCEFRMGGRSYCSRSCGEVQFFGGESSDDDAPLEE